MRVVSINLNGIRSSYSKGFAEWLHKCDADVVCMQEIRIQTRQLTPYLLLEGWHMYMYPANKAGYSGTAILSKRQADDVSYGLGFELCDNEGRFITARYDDLHISSLYLPSAYGTTQPRKDNFLDEFASRLDIPNHILCGDFNICHRAIDMYRPDDEVSGFLPHEQMWMDDLMQEYTDCWRALNPDKVAYSWWSHRNNAFQNNHGWRIDYCLSNHLKPVKSVIDMVRFSDHSPVITDFEDL